MPKTPRFVKYIAYDEPYVIHMYTPRCVFKMVNDKAIIHEQWDEDIYEVKLEEVVKKLERWWHFKGACQ